MGVKSNSINLCLESVYPISKFCFQTDSSIVLRRINRTKDVCKPLIQHGLFGVRD